MNLTLVANLTSATPHPAVVPLTPQHRTGTIVVVEDPVVSGLLRTVLQREGYEVVALRPAEGVSLLRSDGISTSLLITNQPAAFGEFADRVPLLYLAAFPDPAAASRFRASRMLSKPFHPQQLVNCVEQLLLPM